MNNPGFKKVSALITAFIMAFVLIAALFSPLYAEAAGKISLSKTSATMTVGDTLTLKLNGVSTVSWSTSDKAVATVSGGKVTAKKSGTATISAKANGKTYKCKITVRSFLLKNSARTLAVGESLTLKLQGNTDGKKITWSSSNGDVLTINKNGKITAKKSGEATITVKVGTAKVSRNFKVRKYVLSDSKKTITVGNTISLKVSGDTKGKTVTWSSNKTSVATVSKSGVVTAKKAGIVTISVKIGSTKISRKITVKNKAAVTTAVTTTAVVLTTPVTTTPIPVTTAPETTVTTVTTTTAATTTTGAYYGGGGGGGGGGGSTTTRYNLTISHGDGGTITGNSGRYAYGTKISITATPETGYSFVNWTTSNGGTFDDANSPATTFTMPRNAVTITANFKKDQAEEPLPEELKYTEIEQVTAAASASNFGVMLDPGVTDGKSDRIELDISKANGQEPPTEISEALKSDLEDVYLKIDVSFESEIPEPGKDILEVILNNDFDNPITVKAVGAQQQMALFAAFAAEETMTLYVPLKGFVYNKETSQIHIRAKVKAMVNAVSIVRKNTYYADLAAINPVSWSAKYGTELVVGGDGDRIEFLISNENNQSAPPNVATALSDSLADVYLKIDLTFTEDPAGETIEAFNLILNNVWSNPSVIQAVNAAKTMTLYVPLSGFAYNSSTSQMHIQVKVNITVSSVTIVKKVEGTPPVQPEEPAEPAGTSLYKHFESNFEVGVAVGYNSASGGWTSMLDQKAYTDIIKANFSSITAENNMKPQTVLGYVYTADTDGYPKINTSSIDHYLSFAKNNGIKVRYHTLVWHSQMPDWFFFDNYNASTGKQITKDVMLRRMENYITKVITYIETKYPGVVYTYDVVNEAITGEARDHYWYKIMGNSDDYVGYAFKYAREALKKFSSGATLTYNDYNCYIPNKNKEICDLISRINSNAHPANLGGEKLVDAAGMQMHIDVSYPSVNGASSVGSVEWAISNFANAGVNIQITELDVQSSYSEQNNNESVAAARYKSVFQLLVDLDGSKTSSNKPIDITSVSVWGVSDKDGWRSEILNQGKLDQYSTGNLFPLLFNKDMKPNQAYNELLKIN